jgi:hypothetical protein
MSEFSQEQVVIEDPAWALDSSDFSCRHVVSSTQYSCHCDAIYHKAALTQGCICATA